MYHFTTQQLETIAKENTPRGNTARRILDTRVDTTQAPLDGAEDVLQSSDPDVQVTEENAEKPVKTNRKRARKLGGNE